jgi:carbonic anhydrase
MAAAAEERIGVDTSSVIDAFVEWNRQNADRLARPGMPPQPRRRVAVVTCMDARIKVEDMIGIQPGEVHVLRNAGALVTEDTIRSLLLSQHLLGTEAVMVVGHTKCGLEGLVEPAVRRAVEAATGSSPGFVIGSFDDVVSGVGRSLDTLRSSPFARGEIRGFVYDVDTGRLSEVG